jgi:hypothetical protein
VLLKLRAVTSSNIALGTANTARLAGATIQKTVISAAAAKFKADVAADLASIP